VMGSCEHDKEPLGSVKDGEFIDQLTNYQLLRNGTAPRNKKRTVHFFW
jgi:hypothetical protein